jgi:peptidoglycan hydrolase-like protein with peptidoglycan-binding domain
MKRTKLVLGHLAAAVVLAGATQAGAIAGTQKPVRGLDGAEYLPYKASVVRETQQELHTRGLYAGDVNGELDSATMKAIERFQKENGLHASGMPTPATRHALAK